MITNGRMISYTIYFALCEAFFMTFLKHVNFSDYFITSETISYFFIIPLGLLILADMIFSTLYQKARPFKENDNGYLKFLFENHPLGKRYFSIPNIILAGSFVIFLASAPDVDFSGIIFSFWPVISIISVSFLFFLEFMIVSVFRAVISLGKN